MLLSFFIAALIITSAFASVNLTRDLPSIDAPAATAQSRPMACCSNPRASTTARARMFYTPSAPPAQLPRAATFPSATPIRNSLPKSLADAVIARTDPQFWKHSGYSHRRSHQPRIRTPPSRNNLSTSLLLFNRTALPAARPA
jgi:hypothetical protein